MRKFKELSVKEMQQVTGGSRNKEICEWGFIVGGTAASTGYGAAAGAAFGGPIGAAVGAAVGIGASVIGKYGCGKIN